MAPVRAQMNESSGESMTRFRDDVKRCQRMAGSDCGRVRLHRLALMALVVIVSPIQPVITLVVILPLIAMVVLGRRT